MMNTNERNEILQLFEEFLKTMELLRAKCPWDAKQTIPSLRQYTIEEVFELADAIVKESWEDVRKELGDILMHIVFYSLIANEEGKFSLADVLRGENDKLIYRHPHVFDPSSRLTAREVEEQWEDLKMGIDACSRAFPVRSPQSQRHYGSKKKPARRASIGRRKARYGKKLKRS